MVVSSKTLAKLQFFYILILKISIRQVVKQKIDKCEKQNKREINVQM